MDPLFFADPLFIAGAAGGLVGNIIGWTLGRHSLLRRAETLTKIFDRHQKALVSFSVSGQAIDKLQALQTRLENVALEEVFRRALALYVLLLDSKDGGAQIIARKGDVEQEIIVK